MRITVIGQITLTSAPQQATSRPATAQAQAYPSPPRSCRASLNPTTEAPPELPAFSILQTAQATPEAQSAQEKEQHDPTAFPA